MIKIYIRIFDKNNKTLINFNPYVFSELDFHLKWQTLREIELIINNYIDSMRKYIQLKIEMVITFE